MRNLFSRVCQKPFNAAEILGLGLGLEKKSLEIGSNELQERRQRAPFTSTRPESAVSALCGSKLESFPLFLAPSMAFLGLLLGFILDHENMLLRTLGHARNRNILPKMFR